MADRQTGEKGLEKEKRKKYTIPGPTSLPERNTYYSTSRGIGGLRWESFCSPLSKPGLFWSSSLLPITYSTVDSPSHLDPPTRLDDRLFDFPLHASHPARLLSRKRRTSEIYTSSEVDQSKV